MTKKDKVYEGYYTDGGDAENWTDSPLKDSRLVRGPLLSGDYEQPKFTDYAGGRSAKAPKGPVERGSTSDDEPRTKTS
jgi:hypothetical protein